MKMKYRQIYFISAFLGLFFWSCNNEEPSTGNQNFKTITIGFRDVPENLIADNAYGSNLYYGSPNQITTGYLAEISNGIFAQFSINYGYTFGADFSSVWGYSLYQGGLAVSRYYDKEDESYANQLSVYATTSPSGGNFVVATGVATDENYALIQDPANYSYGDYKDCARIYITDSKGYTVDNPGIPGSFVSGTAQKTKFNSVMVANTTFSYLTMKEGDYLCDALNTTNGWFKVQFIAFENSSPEAKALGFVESYLANFDKNLEDKAGYYGKIIDNWTLVDLSSLPPTSVLVINFVGNQFNQYGFATPAYCALDNFEFIVEEN